MIRNELLSSLVNPYTKNEIKCEDGRLVDATTGEHFDIKDGIPIMLREEKVTGLNLTYQKRYDWMCYFYDLLAKFVAPLFGADEVFGQIAEIIDIRSSDWVLETSIGTGKQVENLLNHEKVAQMLVGLDISYGMLSRCRRNAQSWQISPELIQGNAETLPFEDEIFDVVFHIGGINFFEEKEQAVLEMIRVAKPGARLYIGDETQQLLQEQPSIFNRFYQKPETEVYAPPMQFIPEDMSNVNNNELWDEKMYLISLEKPKN